MFTNKAFQITIGGIALLLSSIALITQNVNFLLLPTLQIILGFTVAGMINAGISSFRNNQKRWGFSFLFIGLLLLFIVVSNNTFTIKGLIPVVVLYTICGIPILFMAMNAHYSNNDNDLTGK